MTAFDFVVIRDAADRADTKSVERVLHELRDSDEYGWAEAISLIELLSVLVPAARIAADLLDAIGDPDTIRLMADNLTGIGWTPEAEVMHALADAAAAAREEQ